MKDKKHTRSCSACEGKGYLESQTVLTPGVYGEIIKYTCRKCFGTGKNVDDDQFSSPIISK